MIQAARQFVRKVLLLHLVLLVVVLGIVVMAARALYGGARDQAILQARQRQELLADQTAAAIESYYGSMLDNLDLLRRASDEPSSDTQPATTQAAPVVETRPAAPSDFGRGFGQDFGRGPGPGEPGQRGGGPGRFGGGGGRGGRGNPFAQFGGLNPALVWRQLTGRASFMFTYDRVRGTPVGTALPEGSDAAAKEAMDEAGDWMKTITRGEVSPFLKIGTETGHVIAVPSMNGELVMAAFVPLKNIREKFFDPLNKSGEIRVSLVDQEGNIMAASEATSIGLNLKKSGDPTATELFERAIVAREKGSFVVENPVSSEFIKKPRIFAYAKIDRPADVHWAVVISSLLSDTEGVVSRIFARALYWSTFLGISITGIMVSTALLLIRSRTRLERARHEVITRELHEAREIQLAWLPEKGKTPPGVDIAAVNLPASQISGDFYNWFSLPDGRVALAIGDVTGHGMAAAFLMATTQLLVRTTMTRIHDPGMAMEEVNKQLCTQAFRGQFVTMLLMVVNPKDGAVEIASAGHPAPLLGQNGVFEPLEMESQLVLGVDGQEKYLTERFCLEPGAAMLLYTDGVIEAESPDGQPFSARFLVNALTGATEGVQALVGTVVERVKAHSRTGEFADDLTLVAVRLEPASSRLTDSNAIRARIEEQGWDGAHISEEELLVLDHEIDDLASKVKRTANVSTAHGILMKLAQLQGLLALLSFRYGVSLTPKQKALVRSFDRADDADERLRMFREIKEGRFP